MGSVDVFVPCYRYGRFLRECVESVLSQPVPVRVLIIDDASPDNTPEVAAELAAAHRRVAFVRHAENKGHIQTYNEGIEWAAADYMLLLSADDYLLPNALGRAVALLDAHPEVGFTFGEALELSPDHSAACASLQADTDMRPADILKFRQFVEIMGAGNVVRAPTAVVRTDLQHRLDGYRPELPHSGDMELWLRLAAHAAVGRIPQYQAVYRRHEQNMSHEYTGLWDLKQRKAALDLFFESCESTLADIGYFRRRLYRLLALEAVGCASAALNHGREDESSALCEFAADVRRDIRTSLPWMRLACKRRLGPRVARVLRSAFAHFR